MKMTTEEKASRKREREQSRKLEIEEKRIAAEMAQPPIFSLTILIEWKKSKVWGRNPHATAKVIFADGSYQTAKYTCSGCGYDKESTVIAAAFNDFLKYRLWELKDKINANAAPYGISHYYVNQYNYSGGVGTSCYYNISEFIGGKFSCLVDSKWTSVYQFAMEAGKNRTTK